MEKLYIDVYEQYWDEQSFGPIENKHIAARTYFLEKSIEDIDDEIHQLLGINKNDGYYVEIEKVNNTHFINIFLMVFQEEPFNIKFIDEYFEPKSIQFAPFDKNSKSKKVDTYYSKSYISLEHLTDEEIHEVENLLKNEGVKGKIKNKEIKILEKGASDYHINTIIEITSTVASVGGVVMFVDYLKGKYLNDINNYTEVSFDWEKLKSKISICTGINEQDLRLRNFKRNEQDGLTELSVYSRYKNVLVKCNQNMEIFDVEIKDKSQTLL